MDSKLLDKIVKVIKKSEGVSLDAYQCSMGFWTIGYGTLTLPNGNKVKKGDKISMKEAIVFLYIYINKEIKPQLKKLNLFNDNQKVAVASLIYNCGVLKVKCPKLYKAILDRDYVNIYRQWDYGVKNFDTSAGILTRRAEELYLFFKYPYK